MQNTNNNGFQPKVNTQDDDITSSIDLYRGALLLIRDEYFSNCAKISFMFKEKLFMNLLVLILSYILFQVKYALNPFQ